jgi:hypothetical protein
VAVVGKIVNKYKINNYIYTRGETIHNTIEKQSANKTDSKTYK